MRCTKTYLFVLLVTTSLLKATPDEMAMNPTPSYPQSPTDCSFMQIWDVGMNMCMPYPREGMPMKMAMLSGSVYGGYIAQEGPRGHDAWVSTNMIMADIGMSLSDRHYLNVDLMMTAEKWTLPNSGYPLFLQIGEENAQAMPFIDAQHPHSSPLMGLTLSDTIRLGTDDALKFFFAPRGETTDGPIAFMHRVTGMINPDAPLGHHIGQDVGHVTSTVIGGSLKWGSTRIEASTFHGGEPSPTRVDLPLGTPDSIAIRLIQEFTSDHRVMASGAYINQPEPSAPDITNEWRYSASTYDRFRLSETWTLHHTLIYGAVTHYDRATWLNSLSEEFLFSASRSNLWGRLEVLQRTPEELEIPVAGDANSGRWVAAFTLGYTYYLAKLDGATLGLGASITKDFLPDEFASSYGGNPWSGKLFLHLKGMRMWDL